jgi:hypothetical protein
MRPTRWIIAFVALASWLNSLEAQPTFYDRSRLLDLTSDGRTDTLRLVAQVRSDSRLQIHLVAVTEAGRDTLAGWDSGYELIDPPDDAKEPGPGRDAYLRSQFDRILAEAAIVPFSDSTLSRPWIQPEYEEDCESDVHHCIVRQLRRYAEMHGQKSDSTMERAVVDDINRNATHGLLYHYGYETVTQVVWSRVARRFLVVSSCC